MGAVRSCIFNRVAGIRDPQRLQHFDMSGLMVQDMHIPTRVEVRHKDLEGAVLDIEMGWIFFCWNEIERDIHSYSLKENFT